MSHARILAELRARCKGELSDSPGVLGACARDFGGMRQRMPALVLYVVDEGDVTAALEIAAHYGFAVTVRGCGHSQAGQGLGDGLVLDLTRFDRVVQVDREHGRIEVEAGASWRKLVDACVPFRLLPVGLTHALDTTIGGTLSVAGVGAESFRVGPQVDNVAFLDVALLNGEVVRCSRDRSPELFDSVRAGLGQCGVILRVGYPLRECKPLIRTRGFAYRAIEPFLRDVETLADPHAEGRLLSATLVRDPLRPTHWMPLLSVGQEWDPDAQSSPAELPTLNEDFEIRARVLPTWSGDGLPGHPFFRVFGNAPTALGLSALNPWVEHLFTPRDSGAALAALLDSGEVLARGRNGIIFVRRGRDPAPLFAVPGDGLSIGLGAFATFLTNERDAAHTLMADYAERMRPFGGKRYLSGYLTHAFAADWAQHYEGAWSPFIAAKTRYDPHKLLNRGFIDWG